jgi:hypothetical protein
VALALGYDVDAALERRDPEGDQERPPQRDARKSWHD